MGNGGMSNSSTPVDVQTSSSDNSALDGIAAISSGREHTCALTTGSNVKCWGNGKSGRLGNKATTSSSTPEDVQTSSSDNSALDGIAEISSGDSHTCAVTTGGNVKCWGDGDSGRLGNGGAGMISSSTPVDVHTSSTDNSALGGITAVSSGGSQTCAVTTGGNVKCWGNGFSGRLGNGGTGDSTTPVDVQTSSTDTSALGGITAISSGDSHSCAVTTGSNVVCWGNGRSGRLGNGARSSISTPVDVHTSSTDNSALSGIAAISSGRSHSCAVTTGSNVLCWGDGDSGQLGNGGPISSTTPVGVHTSSSDDSALSGIAAISSGREHTCAVTTGDNVKCWGSGSSGRLGNGGTDDSSTPVDVHSNSTDTSPLGDIAAISSGKEHTCALTSDGNVKCWGSGSSGRLGNGGLGVASSSTPVDVHTSSSDPSPLDGIAAISSGREHSCAVTTSSNVVCWGSGRYGQLGNGGRISSSTPVDVHTSSSDSSVLSGITAVSSGGFHTCAVTTGGNVKCWGGGSSGQLGNRSIATLFTPDDVHTSSSDPSPLDGIAAISSGYTYTCAITKDNNVKCWGYGFYGQLGNNTTTNSSIPVDVQSDPSDPSLLGGIAGISSGNNHICALTEGNDVLCWGNESSGQLGNNGVGIPVSVIGLGHH